MDSASCIAVRDLGRRAVVQPDSIPATGQVVQDRARLRFGRDAVHDDVRPGHLGCLRLGRGPERGFRQEHHGVRQQAGGAGSRAGMQRCVPRDENLKQRDGKSHR